MLAIKLSRTGKKAKPNYRIIVLDSRKDPWGDFLENLGTYNPRTKELVIKADRVKEYLSKGAQPSDTVHNILVSEGIIEAKKKSSSRISKKRQEKLNEKAKETKAKEEEASAKPEEPKTEEPKVEEAKPEEKKEEESPKTEEPKAEEKASEPETPKSEEEPKKEEK